MGHSYNDKTYPLQQGPIPDDKVLQNYNDLGDDVNVTRVLQVILGGDFYMNEEPTDSEKSFSICYQGRGKHLSN